MTPLARGITCWDRARCFDYSPDVAGSHWASI